MLESKAAGIRTRGKAKYIEEEGGEDQQEVVPCKNAGMGVEGCLAISVEGNYGFCTSCR